MNVCLYYHPEAYTISGPKLMGRHAAGESFLRAFLRYSNATEFWIQVEHLEHARHFAERARAFGRNETIIVVDRQRLGALSQVGVVHHPGPGLGVHAWHRAYFGHGAWSLTGITHTTASAQAMDALVELLIAPIYPWDALICTSTAVKDNVMRVLSAKLDYLKERLGITRAVLPQLPVIPLGVHTDDFNFSPEERALARKALGIEAETIVVLFVGRLSFHAKAHPLAMYQALEAASKVKGQSVVLIQCGWFANEAIAKAFEEGAKTACPSIRVLFLDGRNPELRRKAWACADIFCSFSDNIQETFGLTPVEAMASGLPVVVSDWDGYRDTVRDGVDGFLISTLMPEGGLGGDLALRHALGIDTYDMYCGHTCSLVAVDIEAATKAFVTLFESKELRVKMGESGKERARTTYDWSVIIPQYESLWAELTSIRKAETKKLKAMLHPWPSRMDPFYAFLSYPTHRLTRKTRLALVDSDLSTALKRVFTLKRLAMVGFARAILPDDSEIEKVLAQASSGPKEAWELVGEIPEERKPFVFRSLVWLVKLGILRVCP